MNIKKIIDLLIIVAFCFSLFPQVAFAATWNTYSPDNTIRVEIELDSNGELFYKVYKDTTNLIIDKSKLGINTNIADFNTGMDFVSTSTTSWNNSYSMPNGKKATYTDNCNQRELVVSKGVYQLKIYFRVYNDGITFRYYIPGSGAAMISQEYSEFNLPDGTGGWGHLWRNEYEGEYVYKSSTDLNSGNYSMPLLASINNNSYWALLTEANVYNADATYCESILQGSSGQKMKVAFSEQQTTSISTTYPFQTPQRVAIITGNLNDLVNSTLVTDTNPSSEISDTSWIKPGRAAWSWWSEDYYDDVDNTFQRQKQYVDFAAAMGWEYVTVDAGWADWPAEDGNIQDLCDYAATKGVGIFIWANGTIYLKPEYATPDNRYYADDYIDQDTGEWVRHIDTWSSWGIKGIKVDFMMDDSQQKMKIYQNIIELCAEHGLMVNFHGCTKPSGENRTWPNVVTSEAIRGAEHYLNWFPITSPYHNCTVPFTRNVIGPMDYTPVVISNTNRNTTQAHQLALSVIYESGLQHLADSIDIYEAWKGTEFLRTVPSTWDETKLIDGFPGDYVIMARRKGLNWYIGAITDAPRTVSIPLSFLGSGNFTAYTYKDGSTGEFLNKIQSTVTNTTTLDIPLLDNGGCAILISNSTVPNMPSDGFTGYEAESAANTLAGGATVYNNSNCSGGAKVGYIGNNLGTLQFNNIYVPAGQAGNYIMKLYFLSGDERWVHYKVNNGADNLLILNLPSGSFNIVRTYTTTISLAEGNNTIKFSHTDWAPDIDKISIKKQ